MQTAPTMQAAPARQPATTGPTAPTRPAGPSPRLQPGGAAPQAANAAQAVQVAALQEDALDAALLLGRRIDVPLPREQVAPLLQGLLDEGSDRFDAFRARLAANPRLQATPEQQQEMRQFGELSLRLRRSAAALGWLPAQAAPTAALPAGTQPPADGNWDRPMRSLFTPGTASGARNICWFDTLAQLSLDESRDLMGDMQPVDALAAELRATADRLGLTEAVAGVVAGRGALKAHRGIRAGTRALARRPVPQHRAGRLPIARCCSTGRGFQAVRSSAGLGFGNDMPASPRVMPCQRLCP